MQTIVILFETKVFFHSMLANPLVPLHRLVLCNPLTVPTAS